MRSLALTYPEYRVNARKVKLVNTTAMRYYGKGYQDMENRVPKIANTRSDLGWRPRVGMQTALKRIFDAYRGKVGDARKLID